MKKINNLIAVKVTQAVGSMWCAYLFCIIALISLPSAIASHNVLTIVSWVAQTFLQLVLLSVILKGQNIQGERLESVIARIDDNTSKTEFAIERLEHLVRLIEKEEKALVVEGKRIVRNDRA
ncbi:hypothetical protein IZU99_00640 [Oscillospiraceae bacterium CM]|nr:hypothetical protein IZU99_00640 [Oscillospiraceae bacterium CM]